VGDSRCPVHLRHRFGSASSRGAEHPPARRRSGGGRRPPAALGQEGAPIRLGGGLRLCRGAVLRSVERCHPNQRDPGDRLARDRHPGGGIGSRSAMADRRSDPTSGGDHRPAVGEPGDPSGPCLGGADVARPGGVDHDADRRQRRTPGPEIGRRRERDAGAGGRAQAHGANRQPAGRASGRSGHPSPMREHPQSVRSRAGVRLSARSRAGLPPLAGTCRLRPP